MGIIIAIAVIFIVLFLLGVSREVMVLIALSMLLVFAVACALFFMVSLILLMRTKRTEGVFNGLVYGDADEEDRKNKIAFASYTVSGEVIRNLFPTDDFMERFYKKEVNVTLRIFRTKKRKILMDGVTQAIIFIGLPVFTAIAGVLVPLVMQYSFIFSR